MTRWKPFNINDYVRVKLTPRGLEIMEKNYHRYVSTPFVPPQADAGGWVQFQLWRLIREFGPDMSMGSEGTFETNIEIGFPDEEERK